MAILLRRNPICKVSTQALSYPFKGYLQAVEWTHSWLGEGYHIGFSPIEESGFSRLSYKIQNVDKCTEWCLSAPVSLFQNSLGKRGLLNASPKDQNLIQLAVLITIPLLCSRLSA